MKKLPFKSWILIIFAALVAGGIYWYYAHSGSARKAQQIFEETGIKGGLVVHLGCDNGKLTAGLHANDRYLVHGLA
ncbi:MAG: hypothetical protein KGY70_20170, partial [Bacteroidales bacterium]|nr:hypothetical protein [Bacteroidales bacterium]